jgi:hypothetical protein
LGLLSISAVLLARIGSLDFLVRVADNHRVVCGAAPVDIVLRGHVKYIVRSLPLVGSDGSDGEARRAAAGVRKRSTKSVQNLQIRSESRNSAKRAP